MDYGHGTQDQATRGYRLTHGAGCLIILEIGRFAQREAGGGCQVTDG
jgi:hypothetical protein